jgi:arginine deiminase
MNKNSNGIKVSSEVGRLRRLLVHSPDSGLGKVVPSKAQDWLFEDIVHLETIRKKEYDFYTKLLLYFLDPDLILGHLKSIDAEKNKRNFYKPGHKSFFRSDKVIELQWLLAEILEAGEPEELRVRRPAHVHAVHADNAPCSGRLGASCLGCPRRSTSARAIRCTSTLSRTPIRK